MTEYESAQLVFMQAERLANITSLIQGNASLVKTDVTQALTLLFGYLLTAYFVGANLTRIQVSILNVLYFVAFGLTAVSVANGLLIEFSLVDRLKEVSGEGFQMAMNIGGSALFPIAVTLIILLLVASFYFMWSIRHPKSA